MAQSHILLEVRRLGSPSMLQVAQELGVDVTTFSRQIKALEARALISREVSSDDRRVMLLGLTAEGARVLERIDGYMAARLGKVFDGMTPFERETVVEAQPVTGAERDRKVDEVKGTQASQIRGNNVADFRKRVQRMRDDTG